MTRILFVCLGNICRSPMAEFVMKQMVKEAGLEEKYYIASAATSTEEIGNPVYPPVKKLLSEHGIDCSGKTARQMKGSEYGQWDLIIGMDESNLRHMRQMCLGDPEGKMRLLLDDTDHPHAVADPWYTRDFTTTWNEVNEGCRALLKKLEN